MVSLRQLLSIILCDVLGTMPTTVNLDRKSPSQYPDAPSRRENAQAYIPFVLFGPSPLKNKYVASYSSFTG
jgi:hypothetical protein